MRIDEVAFDQDWIRPYRIVWICAELADGWNVKASHHWVLAFTSCTEINPQSFIYNAYTLNKSAVIVQSSYYWNEQRMIYKISIFGDFLSAWMFDEIKPYIQPMISNLCWKQLMWEILDVCSVCISVPHPLILTSVISANWAYLLQNINIFSKQQECKLFNTLNFKRKVSLFLLAVAELLTCLPLTL